MHHDNHRHVSASAEPEPDLDGRRDGDVADDETHPAIGADARPADASRWRATLEDHLTEAARLAARHGVALDAFAHGAWSAYVDAHPGLREQLADAELRARLDELRANGRIASA